MLQSRWVALRGAVLRVVGRVSMYRFVLGALIVLWAVAFAISFSNRLAAQPLALVLSAVVMLVVTTVTDLIGHRLIARPLRLESGWITALILVFVLYPTSEPEGLALLALAAFLGTASKYLLAPRGRHLFNPAAFGAAVVTVVGLAPSMWWVGSPLLAAAVILLGLLLVWRTGQARVVFAFIGAAVIAIVIVRFVTSQTSDFPFSFLDVLRYALFSSPVLFLGFFMLTEPLTLPSSLRARLAVALITGVLVGAPFNLGSVHVFPEVALLAGNVVAFALSRKTRHALNLSIVSRALVAEDTQELTLRASHRVHFIPGQYLELEVAHPRPDLRGTRREFSIVSAPSELPLVRLAYRESPKRPSSYKRALGTLPEGAVLSATGVWGEFTLPHDPRTPVLLIGAGIGVTPFVSQVCGAPAGRDIVVILLDRTAARMAYVPELAASAARVIAVTRTSEAPDGTGVEHVVLADGARFDEALLTDLVPDLSTRHAFVSGPPALLTQLAPALAAAKHLHTDAFAGY